MKKIVPSFRQSIHISHLARAIILGTMLFVLFPEVGTSSALADTKEKASEIGLGVASFVTTLPYGAVKLAYAGLGTIVGGFTYLLTAGDLHSANVIWEKSLLGHYVITPDHLTGDKPVKFVGP